ncbi:MAG: hypothetical protein IKM66_02015 [Clostridia bacterium]|nr:hypothetical protein [Clostridia bacterium]
MSEYNMSHTGAELDDAINKVKNGYILPSGNSPTITTNGTHNVKQYENAVVSVPQGMTQHTKISKTIGSSSTQSYSIPLSEIGFTPKAYAVIAYPSSEIASAVSGQPHILGTANNLGSSNPSGCISASASGVIKIQTVGGSFSGAVNGNNFTFTSTYAYLRGSIRYYFYFWG